MLLSINWLKDFVKLPSSLSAEDISRKLTAHTVEVEGIIYRRELFDKVTVGRVLQVKPHPNADRLRLVKVDIKKQTLDIVCGAPNVAAGQLVPVALVGAKLPNGLEIKESEIRGEKSQGMICAEDELGLGRNHEGIMVLDKAKIGQDFADYLGSADVILEIDNKSLSNRSDLWGQYGLAREVAALFDLKLKPYSDICVSDIKTGPEKLALKVEEEKLCPAYSALKVDNIKVGSSPAWLKERLVAIGLKPINNIVDLTNFVMFESGQPLHAFDGDLIDKIVVRRAKKNEMLVTLDEVERPLTEDMLLITDGRQPLAIAGVMGGLDSGIKEGAKSLIIEAANFEPVSIRKTAAALGLRTEASLRFEKGLDPNLTHDALKRFLYLLFLVCPEAKVSSELAVVENFNLYLGPVEFSSEFISDRLGIKLEKKKIIHILEKLGFEVSFSHNVFSLKIPSWRAAKDVSNREDILEEIARVYGYDNLPSIMPVGLLAPMEHLPEYSLEKKIKDSLAFENSLSEVYNYSFTNESQLKKLNIDFQSYLKLVNPISEQHTMLRQSLIPGLVASLRLNQFNYDDIGLFELGRIFLAVPGGINKDNGHDFLPYQEKSLGLVLAGANTFSRLKGIISNFFDSLFSARVDFVPTISAPAWSLEGGAAQIMIFGKIVGSVALLDPSGANASGLKKEASLAEIDFAALLNIYLSQSDKQYLESPKFPALVRDMAFVVSEKILYNELRAEILNFNPLVKSVELFDVYSGDRLERGKKSLAFHISLQSPDRTLTANEADDFQELLVAHLLNRFEARLRDF